MIHFHLPCGLPRSSLGALADAYWLREVHLAWIHGRGEFYASLRLHLYLDGEPYFASQGAAMSLSDFLRPEADLTGPKQQAVL